VEEHESLARPEPHRLCSVGLGLSAVAALVERPGQSVGDVQACLRDHDNFPDSVCRHVNPDDPPEEACITVVSVVMDLSERILWISDGAPCEHPYEAYTL